jgi:hypothetical protein
MSFTFKLSHRLAKNFWVVGAAAALFACAGEQSITDPTTPPDTTAATPNQPNQPNQPPAQPPSQPQPTTHVGFFVAPNGSSSADGSMNKPMDLATALSGAGGQIGAGDTIWVRAGTYYAPFRSTVSGQSGKPVVIRAYPGERAIIDGVRTTGDNFVVKGSYTIVWGLEFTNSGGSRSTSVINHDYRANQVINSGPHNKYVNLIVHDNGTGFYGYSNQPDVEIYGSIFYNIGWMAPDRGHGHALYLKSDNGPLVVKDNVVFNQFGFGMHVYTNVGDGLLNNIRLEGNVSFNNGSNSTLGSSGNISNLGVPEAKNLAVISNMTYMGPSMNLSSKNLSLGSGTGLTATNNFVVGASGLTEGSWSGSVVKNGNTVLAASRSSSAPKVFVRPNAYEKGRGNIVVYNFNGQGSVAVDLGNVLSSGDRYEVRNVQNLNGTPVASGTFSGGSVSIPLNGVTPPTPVGLSSPRAPRTGPDFDVFIVVKVG